LNCKEYLDIMPEKNLRKIAEMLRIALPGKSSLNYIKYSIGKVLCDWDSINSKIMKWLDKEDKECLLQLVFTSRTNCNTLQLSHFGLIHNDIMPNDVVMLLQKNLRNEITCQCSLPDKFLLSALSQLLLLLDFVSENDKVISKDQLLKMMSAKYCFVDQTLCGNVISYLEYKSLISYPKKKKLKVDPRAREKLFGIPENAFFDFYVWLFKKYRLEDMLWFVGKVSEIQGEMNEWVSTKIFSDVRQSTSLREAGLKMGLFTLVEKDKMSYLRLTPEGRFLVTKKYPPYWQEKRVIISADFEVLVPHNYDPFAMLELFRNCRLKEVGYVLVFDILQEDNVKFSENFLDIVLNRSLELPDVVRFELFRTANALPKPNFKKPSSG